MSHHLGNVEHIDEAMHDCITNCSECHDVCTATVEHCLQRGDELMNPELIRTLLDCAQACDTSRDFMLRGSPLHHVYCRGCAHACGSLREFLREVRRRPSPARVRPNLPALHDLLPRDGRCSQALMRHSRVEIPLGGIRMEP